MSEESILKYEILKTGEDYIEPESIEPGYKQKYKQNENKFTNEPEYKQNKPEFKIFYEKDVLIQPQKHNNSAGAILLIFIIIIIIIIAFYCCYYNNGTNNFLNKFKGNILFNQLTQQDLIPNRNYVNTDPLQIIKDPYPIDRMYYSDQVDPIVTGNLYRNTNNLRPIYNQRTAFGIPKWETQYAGQYGYHAPTGQLTEFNTSGASGDVGVTKGPIVFNSEVMNYVGPIVYPPTYDDGMPEQWNLPSTPLLSYYESHIPTEDYYGPEGATPYSLKGFNVPFEPDHEPLLD